MKRTLSILLTLALAAPAPLLPANVNLPDLGDSSAAVISPAQERKLGEETMREIRRVYTFVDDAEINAYLQSLGQRLVAHSDMPSQDFHFFVINDPSINAFALPGGYIGVHTGLLLSVRSEAELASVLAHETAHITQRHIPRLLAEQKSNSLPAMAALLAGILLASSGNRGGDAALAVTSATLTQKAINFTRANEEEADRIGTHILADSGFDPRAMPAFFERLQNLNRYNESDMPGFLRTHPVTTARISDSRARAEQYPLRQVPDTIEFQLARAKLRAWAADDAAEIARAFAQGIKQESGVAQDAERYGYTIALMRSRRYDEARAEARRLIDRTPQNVSYRMLQAEVEMAAGHMDNGIALYGTAYKRNSYYPLALDYARSLLKVNRAREAEPVIRETLKTRHNDPLLYQLLAQAAGANGKIAESHQALAEHYYLNGNRHAAIEQLQLASHAVNNNFYLQSSIEARMHVIRDELGPGADNPSASKP
ncbi:MAG: M48 family metallopeptidase [Gammaproteobacteria bacterium]|nr:M48 family metallopeptidase [Gammaproteobacteria bacterium]